MARPVKNACDYFPHDKDMRNHKKIKSLRNKFGIAGYAIWNMLLEYLTGGDGNEFESSEMEFELMSGDFGVSVAEITDVVNYCIRLELLFVKNGFIHSESLDENLAPVYEKRHKAKELSAKQRRKNGKFDNNNTDDTVVTVSETPQSKVDKSKEKEIKLSLFETFWKSYGKSADKKKCLDKFLKLKSSDIEKILLVVDDYVKSTPDVQFRKNPLTWLNRECWNDEVVNYSKLYQQPHEFVLTPDLNC